MATTRGNSISPPSFPLSCWIRSTSTQSVFMLFFFRFLEVCLYVCVHLRVRACVLKTFSECVCLQHQRWPLHKSHGALGQSGRGQPTAAWRSQMVSNQEGIQAPPPAALLAPPPDLRPSPSSLIRITHNQLLAANILQQFWFWLLQRSFFFHPLKIWPFTVGLTRRNKSVY